MDACGRDVYSSLSQLLPSSLSLSLSLSLSAHAPMHLTVRHHQVSWDKYGGRCRVSCAHSTSCTPYHLIPIAQFCLAAIITPTSLRLHDPHCLTARLDSSTLHILFLRARLPTSVPNLLIHLATPHLDLSLVIHISDIIRRVYSCPSLCHWHSLPPTKSSSVHYNESHTSINALTCVAI